MLIPKETPWLLVHNENKVLAFDKVVFEGKDIFLKTKHTVFLAATKEECEKEIIRLNLKK